MRSKELPEDLQHLSGRDRAEAARTARAGQANAASEHMIVPVALLGIAFMALIGYPAFARILFG